MLQSDTLLPNPIIALTPPTHTYPHRRHPPDDTREVTSIKASLRVTIHMHHILYARASQLIRPMDRCHPQLGSTARGGRSSPTHQPRAFTQAGRHFKWDLNTAALLHPGAESTGATGWHLRGCAGHTPSPGERSAYFSASLLSRLHNLPLSNHLKPQLSYLFSRLLKKMASPTPCYQHSFSLILQKLLILQGQNNELLSAPTPVSI